ncbi:RING-H2 finger protein ATL5-like [Telopea speciosissima]|uniref:RING-H2 finger protein ATL5-like n=1 Tax=Telopea speciosissima TaxID=54955 RepID=UPI001CC4979C|nr:RING-H2 finger protein ATL5-like [Telopea speciosissima]
MGSDDHSGGFSFVDADVWYHSISKIIALCAVALLVNLLFVYACTTYRRQTREREREREAALSSSSINYGGISSVTQLVDLSRLTPPIENILHPSVIASLPTFVYKVGHLHTKFDTVVECAVCLNKFEEGDMIKLIPTCNHMFHLQCINTWLRSHSTCPICRSAVQAASTAEGTSHDASSQTTSKDDQLEPNMITIDGRRRQETDEV